MRAPGGFSKNLYQEVKSRYFADRFVVFRAAPPVYPLCLINISCCARFCLLCEGM